MLRIDQNITNIYNKTKQNKTCNDFPNKEMDAWKN